LSNQFGDFLSKFGIFHRLTSPHISYENEITKSKHRYIQELGLIILTQSCLKQTYWVVTFLTIVYLINRLPTKVLQNYNPHEVLNGQTPNYSKLPVFGCSCYSFLRPYQPYNLAHKSKQCVFLGYSRNQKGYRCLDSENN